MLFPILVAMGPGHRLRRVAVAESSSTASSDDRVVHGKNFLMMDLEKTWQKKKTERNLLIFFFCCFYRLLKTHNE